MSRKRIKESRTEREGDDQGCTCWICMAVSVFALKVANLDAIDGYRRGLSRYHEVHDVPIEAYLSQMTGGERGEPFWLGYTLGELQSADGPLPERKAERAVTAYEALVSLLEEPWQ